MPAEPRAPKKLTGARSSSGSASGYWRRLPLAVAGSLLSLAAIAPADGQVILTEGTNLSVDVAPPEGPIATDLLGSIWLVPQRGGAAEKIINNLQPASHPRWSPDGGSILYQVQSALGSQIWLHDREAGTTVRVSDGRGFDQQADWHPDGGRIVYASQRGDQGFDLRETHLKTGLGWQLTSHPGDETWPAWSADGEDLAYVHEIDDEWRLILRRHGRPEETLLVSLTPIAAPSWRPDGSLLTFLRQRDESWTLDMVILSDPPLVRTLASGEDFFLSPVSWHDRQLFYYTADGMIKERRFNDWKGRPLTFRAMIGAPAPRRVTALTRREVEPVNPSTQRLLIRTRRLFDGESPGYREDLEVLIENGRIAAVAPRGEIRDATVLDLGDATLLPGFIDVYARLDEGDPRTMGWRLLSYGVTTLVVEDAPGSVVPELWETPASLGPRLMRAVAVATNSPADDLPREDDALPALVTLPAGGLASPQRDDPVRGWQTRGVPVLAENWIAGLLAGADLLLGAETLPSSPRGRRYSDLAAASSSGSITLVSGLATAGTPGVPELLESRQATLSSVDRDALRRHAAHVDLTDATSTVVVGSRPNGLPAGLALHAELRALQAAGLSGDRVLQAAGASAARVLGLDRALGRIAPGAIADLVIVAGDPRARVADAIDIVAVIRNGHFMSLVRLLEQARDAGVE